MAEFVSSYEDRLDVLSVTSLYKPAFTFDHEVLNWNQSYWALTGEQIVRLIKRLDEYSKEFRTTSRALWVHSPEIGNSKSKLRVQAVMPITSLEEAPEGILKLYMNESFPEEHYPLSYRLSRSWAMLYLKHDTWTRDKFQFSLLLTKLLASANEEGVGLIFLNTQDLYVNKQYSEWAKRFDLPYQVVDDEDKQPLAQWLEDSGFSHYYTPIYNSETGRVQELVPTPWYFHVPEKNHIYGSHTQVKEQYQVHPIKIMGQDWFPPYLVKKTAEPEVTSTRG